jgi:hypothetical protein
MELIWFGSDTWNVTSCAPDYVINEYSKVDSNKMDFTDPNLLAREEYCLKYVMNHIADYIAKKGYSNVVIGVVLLNEPAMPVARSKSNWANDTWEKGKYFNVDSFNTDVLWKYLNGLGEAVKTSNYNVFTRVNFSYAWNIKVINDLFTKNETMRVSGGTNIDFLGMDLYTHSITDLEGYYINKTYNSGRNLMMNMENYASNANSDKLVFTGLANNGCYSNWEYTSTILDEIWNCGMYDLDDAKKTMTPRSHVPSYRNFNNMVKKNWYDLATIKAGTSNIKFYNKYFDESSLTTQTVNNTSITFSTTVGAAGICSYSGNNVYNFLSHGKATYKVLLTPVSLEEGYYNNSNNWVSLGAISYTKSNNEYVFDIAPYQCIRMVIR